MHKVSNLMSFDICIYHETIPTIKIMNLWLAGNSTRLSCFCLSGKQRYWDSVSLQSRGQFCFLSNIIKIISSGASIGHTCLQPITKDSSFLSSRSLSCTANPLCAQHQPRQSTQELRGKGNQCKYEDYDVCDVMRNKVFSLWPRSLISAASIHGAVGG